MGAYLKGQKLEFGRKYSIKQDRTLTRAVYTSKIPIYAGQEITYYNRAYAFLSQKDSGSSETTFQFKIQKNNIFLCDNLNFDNIIKGDITNATKISIENCRICYLSSAQDVFYCTPISNLAGVFNFDISIDTDYVYITISCNNINNVPGAYVSSNIQLSTMRIGGFLGLLKYDNKYIIYDIDNAVYCNTDRLKSSSSPNNRMAIQMIDSSGYSSVEEKVAEVNSGDFVEYFSGTEETIYYLLHTYIVHETDITKPIKGYDLYEEIHHIKKGIKNRRIING